MCGILKTVIFVMNNLAVLLALYRQDLEFTMFIPDPADMAILKLVYYTTVQDRKR